MLTSRFESRVSECTKRPQRRGRAVRLAGCLLPVSQGHPFGGVSLSIRVINDVVENAPVKGGEYLLLLCMARYASDDGGRIFPAVSTLAKDTRQHHRAVHKQLRSLEAKGLIARVGVSQHNTVNYRIVIHSPVLQPSSGVIVGVVRDGPRFRIGGRRTPESSINPSLNRQQPVETPHVKTQVGEAALKRIAELLPKFKPAQQGKTHE